MGKGGSGNGRTPLPMGRPVGSVSRRSPVQAHGGVGAAAAQDARNMHGSSLAPPPDPSEVAESRESLRALTQLLAQISESHLTAFILFEIEGYTGEEIAQLEDIPVNTVWTRLHHARKELYALVAEARAQGRLP